jgi:DNA-directed RNA polymerase specialized sigma24 family protein
VDLDAAIASLPALLEPVVRCCELDELSLEQAAAKLGRPKATVHDQLTRGRALIAQILNKRDGGRRR